VSAALMHKLEGFLRRQRIALGDVVVAVSGGPDSVALLRALVTLKAQGADSGRLTVAHFNHQLRGDESDEDERFVRRLTASLASAGHTGLSLHCQRCEVRSQAAKEANNLEATARSLRYDWLGETARAARAHFVMTGHTADDQAETILHHLLRGTGLKGLRGIAARRGLVPGVELVRPLLNVARAEVLAYLQEVGQDYREDSSNANCAFTRNRIRHELIPYLATNYNPEIVSVLTRLAEQAAETYQDLEERARDLLTSAELPRAGPCLVFSSQRLAAAGQFLQREMFRLAWEREGWPMGKMGFEDWDRLTQLLAGEKAALDLPGGIRARRRDHVVLIGPDS